jgi:CheY-like chemotaxis protein
MVSQDRALIKILLADDDEDDCEIFSEALIKAYASAELKTVKDGDELMKYLSQNTGEHPDIIFLDINMPGKGGKECLKEIRDKQELAGVPVVVFSTSKHPNDIDETFANGANLYISKPAFFQDHVKILGKIFSMNWQMDLLKKNKETFVLYAWQILA